MKGRGIVDRNVLGIENYNKNKSRSRGAAHVTSYLR